MNPFVPKTAEGRLSLVLLALTVLFIAGVRYRLLDAPLERDEGEYAYAGQLILQGIPPYGEIYNVKLPGTYAAYAVIIKIFGQTVRGVHAGLMVVNALTVVLLYLLGRCILRPVGAWFACALFGLLSLGEPVQGVFAHAEHFVLLFSVAGVLVILTALRDKRAWLFFAGGALLGVGMIMKQHGAAFILFGLAMVLSDAFGGERSLWRLRIRRGLWFAAGAASVYAALCLAIYFSGTFSGFWFWTVSYAVEYVSGEGWRAGCENFIRNAWPVLRTNIAVWALVALGFVPLLIKKYRDEKVVFPALFFAFSFMAVMPGLYFRPHYFVLLLPASAVLAGAAFDVLIDMTKGVRRGVVRYGIPAVVVVAVFASSVYVQRAFLFEMSPYQVSRKIYRLNPFPESLVIADYIRRHTGPDDRIAVLGSEPQIYFYAQRRSASSYIYMYPLMETHPFALDMQKEMIRQIEQAEPKFLVIVNIATSWLLREGSHRLVFHWAQGYLSRYRQVGRCEITPDEPRYFWDSEVKQPPKSPKWIGVYQRQ